MSAVPFATTVALAFPRRQELNGVRPHAPFTLLGANSFHDLERVRRLVEQHQCNCSISCPAGTFHAAARASPASSQLAPGMSGFGKAPERPLCRYGREAE
jgi:hypothetical protein